MNPLIIVGSSIIHATLLELQAAGRRRSERVVLWLGRRTNARIEIETLWVPEQRTGLDFFEIPPKGMQKMFDKLRTDRLMVAAQIHSHPRAAFHSYADDQWAIIRHSGALSLVLPYFALRTDCSTFVQDVALFVLSLQNEWLEILPSDVHEFYQISQ
jgi:hypothetical protein